jgi:uncharacterized protein YecE (DUF72 family)
LAGRYPRLRPEAGPAKLVAVILVGTSGFHYEDWRGPFYPPKLPKTRFLEYYSDHFATLELNFTHYRPPDARTLGRMLERSGGRVDFVVKAPRELTHERADPGPIAAALVEAVRPLEDGGKFGAFLCQFPYSFRPVDASRDLVASLRSLLGGRPTVVEFRNASWVREETFELLRREGLAYCAVDEPRLRGLMPPVAPVTASPGYLRFHGRNAASWWDHPGDQHGAARYHYRYNDAELGEWLPRLRDMDQAADRTYVFFNNHTAANAVAGARRLAELLNEDELI